MPSRVDLPRHPVVHGHPIHAMLSDLPVALIPAAFVVELWCRLSPMRDGARLSTAATGAALASATAAGIAGWIDWLTIPTEHPAQQPATLHGLINTAGLVSLAGAAALRRARLPLLGLATLALPVAAWIGGDLVYHYGWRVRPAEEAEVAEKELREAGNEEPFRRARREITEFERRKTFLPE